MQNGSEIQKLLNMITGRLIEYDPGNLLLLSDLQDDFSALGKLFSSGQTAAVENADGSPCTPGELASALSELLRKNFREYPIPEMSRILTEGTDLLLRYASSGEVSHPLLEREIADFFPKLSVFSGSLSGETAEVPVPAGEEASIPGSEKKKSAPVPPLQKSATSVMEFTEEALDIFYSEMEERFSVLNELILRIEEEHCEMSVIHDLFRIVHTIKGESGFLKLPEINRFTHELENLLDRIRNSEIPCDADVTEILFESVDCVKEMVNALKADDLETYEAVPVEKLLIRVRNRLQRTRPQIGKILQAEGYIDESTAEAVAGKQRDTGFQKKFGEVAVEERMVSPEALDAALRRQKAAVAIQGDTHGEQLIKVRASQITQIVNMIGELLIAENQLEDRNLDVLRKITREIQNAAMQLRTTTVKNLFIKLRRMVRDFTLKLGREVSVEVVGDRLEVDRDLVDLLEEPLSHLIRNAIGHGIETPEERATIGKPATGTIILKAERLGNSVAVSVRDDGRGLVREKILKKALEKELVTPEQAPQLSDGEVQDLLFLPGFSTAETVDDVSGRGVGLDVVKTMVKKMRGTIRIRSMPGQFTEMALHFPLSIAIIDGMIVRLSNETFVIPVTTIIECIGLKADDLHPVGKAERILSLRGEILPVIDLHDYFRIPINDTPGGSIPGVIVTVKERKYLLLVDEIVGKKEVVIKPLGERFRDLPGISSGTVLQGGRIGLIIQVEDIVEFHTAEEKPAL